jgi:hypothetical protein
MMTLKNFFSLSLVFVVMSIGLGCQGPGSSGDEISPDDAGGPPPEARFDPLEFASDREVVPEEHPQSGDISGAAVVDEAITSEGPQLPGPIIDDAAEILDTGENYRIQLFTSQVYAEAQRVRMVAEEVFDREVFVDYEVPYFKVRVGNFHDRDKAEAYQQRAKGVGYVDAWVVMVNVELEEAAPLYDSLMTAPADVEEGFEDADDDE